MSYDTAEIWFIIASLAVGTYLIRFSFLGIIGARPMPPFVLRLLRFTPVAVLPGMVAPLVVWPDATGGDFDPVRGAAAAATVAVAYWKRNALWGVAAGAATLYAGLILTGRL